MNLEDAAHHYGNLSQVCIALGIKPQNMTKWKRQGYIPWKQQFKLAMLTEGELMPDEEDPQILKKQGRL